jgi:hypothetical protein
MANSTPANPMMPIAKIAANNGRRAVKKRQKNIEKYSQ